MLNIGKGYICQENVYKLIIRAKNEHFLCLYNFILHIEKEDSHAIPMAST